MNETNLARNLTSNFLIQFVYQQTISMKIVLFSCFSHIKVSCRCLIYMLCSYIFIGAKVNHTSSKNTG